MKKIFLIFGFVLLFNSADNALIKDVAIEKFYKIDFQKTNEKVAMGFRFTNSKENGINQPLPGGKVSQRPFR